MKKIYMVVENLNEILETSNSLNDLARFFFGKENYTNREKSKVLLEENNVDWKEWLSSKKERRNFCKYCGKEITGRNRNTKKFCNSSCAASYNNRLRPKKTKKEKTKSGQIKKSIENKERFCVNCGKPLKKYHQSFFCSLSCSTEHKYLDYIKRWKNGEEDGLKGEYGISQKIRKYLKEKFGNKCQICGWGETNIFTGNVPLEVHHIDGDYRNNKEENLQLLCPNCHSLTETFKNSNKNGRKGRKKYS